MNVIIARRDGGITPRWMGVRDDRERLMVAINGQVGHWRFVGVRGRPGLPGAILRAGIRIGVNYVLYSGSGLL